MYNPNYNNRFYRIYAIEVDKYGIDPLLDHLIPKLTALTSYTNHNVLMDERGAPDLISLREYGTEDYWWHIMAYNGITRFRTIVEGVTLKIPVLGDIIAITNAMMLTNEKTSIATI